MDAKREALNVLCIVSEKEDEDYPDPKKGATASDELAEELRTLRESSKLDKYQHIDMGIQGTVLIVINDEDCDPDLIVASIFRKMSETKKTLFALCTRLYPISIASKASIESIQDNSSIKEYISKYMCSSRPVIKFRIVYKKSLNNEIRRLEVIKAIASFVDPKHKVDMKSPDVTIIINVMKSICTVALSSNHHRYCEYSVFRFLKSLKNK